MIPEQDGRQIIPLASQASTWLWSPFSLIMGADLLKMFSQFNLADFRRADVECKDFELDSDGQGDQRVEYKRIDQGRN